MARKPRDLHPNWCYHITTRCNNRDFRLTQFVCKSVLLFAIKRCQHKYGFKLYGLCIMSNHVHYLLEPLQSEDLPKIMHWLNWFTAMCFNRLLNRTGHFWEKRYHSSGFPCTDYRRALNTLRYIHANPKAADMQSGWFYDFSNYGVYDRLLPDGISQWHPAFLTLGITLDACAAAYRQFCKRYRPRPKSEIKRTWGKQMLAGLKLRKKSNKTSPGQQRLPWDDWTVPAEEIYKVAKEFVLANALNPDIAGLQFIDN
ncbi:MAG: transposase [Leptolyngbya sp. SIO3F4]|nr:transposase [Leptolyngbya sp. SIO3F4]